MYNDIPKSPYICYHTYADNYTAYIPYTLTNINQKVMMPSDKHEYDIDDIVNNTYMLSKLLELECRTDYNPSYIYSYSNTTFEVGIIGTNLIKIYDSIKNIQTLLKNKIECETENNLENIEISIFTNIIDDTGTLCTVKIPKPTNYNFIELCKSGNLNEIKNITKTTLNIDLKLIDRGWFEACLNEHFELIKYLYSCKFDIDYRLAFHRTSIEANLDIVKWQYENKLYADDDCFKNIFMNVCFAGQLEKAKWLIEVEPYIINDISEIVDDDSEIEYGKIHYIYAKMPELTDEHTKVGEWLCSHFEINMSNKHFLHLMFENTN